jgi:hypothetical protein
MKKASLLLSVTVLATLSSVAQAEPKVDVQSIDRQTARVSVHPQVRQRSPQVRETLLRAVSQETLRRGYDWFDLSAVVEITPEHARGASSMERPDNMVSMSGPYLYMAMSAAPSLPTQGSETGLDALVTFGRGAKPDLATAADARTLLANLR